MATPGRPLDRETENRIKRLVQVQSIRQTAKDLELSRNTVRKVIRR